MFTKHALLIVAAMAATALAVPSLASASSWGPIGTTHVLDSSDLDLTIHAGGGAFGVACTAAQLHVDVRSASELTVTNMLFPRDCHGTDLAADCTVTPRATALHWTMTAPTTTNIMIHGVRIDFRFEHVPPSGNNCFFNGADVVVTGTLRNGIWDPAEREITFRKPGATGLVAHGPLGNNLPVTISATFRDTQQTLTLT